MSDTATYVFCLVQSAKAPKASGAPPALPEGGAVRVMPIERGIWAVVADVPLERFSEERLQEELQDVEAVARYALGHAAVVEFFFRQATVIPLKLFTLFSSDERAAKDLARGAGKLRKLFAGVRGLEEWGVRVTAAVDQPALERPRSGREYLAVKKRINQGEVPASTRRVVSSALRALGRLATKVRKENFPAPDPGQPYVAGASFLVRSGKRASWKKEIQRQTRELEQRGHALDVSGPWPPYRFVSGSR